MRIAKIIIPFIVAIGVLWLCGMFEPVERLDGGQVIEYFVQNKEDFYAVANYIVKNKCSIIYSQKEQKGDVNAKDLREPLQRFINSSIITRVNGSASDEKDIGVLFEFKDCDHGYIIYSPDKPWPYGIDLFILEDGWYFFDMNMGGRRG